MRANPDDLATTRLKRFFRMSAREGKAFHVIDVTDLTGLNTNALAVLISALRASNHIGGRVRVAAHSPGVLNVLALTALDQLMPVYSAVSEAEAAFAQCGGAFTCISATAR